MAFFTNRNGIDDGDRIAQSILDAREFQKKLSENLKITSDRLRSVAASINPNYFGEDYNWSSALTDIGILNHLLQKRDELEKIYSKFNELVKKTFMHKRILYGDKGEEFIDDSIKTPRMFK